MRDLKKITGLLLLLTLYLSDGLATDIDVLYSRYWDLSINNPSKTKVDSYLGLLKSDGSFSDLDYSTKTADLSEHLKRLTSLGGAYQSKQNIYYKNTKLKKKYYKSLKFWVNENHTPSNWWFRYIRYPKNFAPCLFLMNVELQKEEPGLFDEAIAYLRWGYLQDYFMNGANGADQIYATYASSILTKDDAQLKEYQQKIKELIVVQNKGEGIEIDGMYGQHSDNGRQLYANYEHEYLNSLLILLDLCKGTIYDASEVELSVLDNHFIEGTQWYVYNNHQDPSQTGRKPSASLNARFPNTLKLLLGLNTPNHSHLLTVQDRIINGERAKSKLLGNRMFWRFDYMIHRRANYFVSSRVTSTRTVGMESGNGEGINNYYAATGNNFLFRTGNEYSGNYFTVMNYRQWPGITAEQDNAVLPLVDWGKNGSNGNSFAGGVSDGMYGAIANIYSRRGVRAHKAWFYFNDEFVALGSGINQTEGTAPLFTTMNQVVQKDSVFFSKNKKQQMVATSSGTMTVENPEWVLQDSIGYINLHPTSNFKISSDLRKGTNIYTVGVEHGVNPVNGSYAYAVYPNISSVTLKNYVSNSPLIILENTDSVQAVYHKTLKMTQAIFYSAGSVTLRNGITLTVNAPCAIILKNTASSICQITVGNPLCETSNPQSITVAMDVKLTGKNVVWDKNLSTVTIALPQGDSSGQSVSASAKYSDELIRE